jgi:ADP-heptose:LPS heptosyltransferase
MKKALLYCAGGGIGDSLVATIVARALHQRFDIVDALTLPSHRETLVRVPDVDDVLVDDGGDERALAATLAQHNYDACVVTWATPRTARVPQLAKIPIRVGQARRLYSFRFTHRVTVRSETGDTTSHWSDVLLDYARVLNCDTNDRVYRFIPTPQDEAEGALVSPGEVPFIILNPCNAIASQRDVWPVEGWAALARALRDRFEVTVLVSGSPADAPIVDAIVAQARAYDGADSATPSRGARDDEGGGTSTLLRSAQRDVVSIAGKTGIGGFGALAQRAKAFVGITTGSMHVAAAVGCPTAGIFPFQSDFPDRWAPLGSRTAIVRPSYPCHRGDTKERCRDYACIAHLDVPRIVAAVESLE